MHSKSLQNRFLGVHDVCLSEVDMVSQFSEDNAKKKRLLYNTQMPPRLSGLQLVLKVSCSYTTASRVSQEAV